MIKIENVEITGWEAAVRGMRNPMNSWDKSDSGYSSVAYDGYAIGPNDHKLMMKLAKGGSVHAKYRRMITVYCDILAPLYWWKDFDTYKVGTVANGCSTMHKIHAKEFVVDDFSHERLVSDLSMFGTLTSPNCHYNYDYIACLNLIIGALNAARDEYLRTHDKIYWWQMIQLLPTSYNQRRTIMFNYEVLSNIYIHRKDHKLDEWRDFCKWIENLPYSEIITIKEEK